MRNIEFSAISAKDDFLPITASTSCLGFIFLRLIECLIVIAVLDGTVKLLHVYRFCVKF